MLSTKDLKKLEAAQNLLQSNNYGADKGTGCSQQNLRKLEAAQNVLQLNNYGTDKDRGCSQQRSHKAGGCTERPIGK
jgi:hypothetical protein